MGSGGAPSVTSPSLLRSTFLVSLCAAASRILGFVRDVLLAGILGAGPVADAFLVAYRIPNLVRRVLTEGGLNAAFVPLYLRLRGESGEIAAKRFAIDAAAGVALILAALLALAELAAGPIVLALAVGYADDPATLGLAVAATRLAFPFVAVATLAGLISAMLNAEKRFVAASLAPIAVNAVMIGALAWLSARPAPRDADAALWLAGMVSLSGIAHLAIVAVAARRLSLPLSLPRLRWSAPMRHLARVAGPALLASGAAQFIVLAAAEAASFQPSLVSWFYYAERVFQLPLGFVGAAAGLVLLPELSRAGHDDADLSARQNRALEAGLLAAIPAAFALVVLAEPIVAILFERGAFGRGDGRGTAAILAGLGAGLPFAAAGKILSQGFFARGDLRTVVLVSLAAMVTTFATAMLLAPVWGAFGIGSGVAAGFVAHALLLGGVLAARGWWTPDRRCLDRVARGAVAALVMAGACSLAASMIPLGPGSAQAALGLAAICIAGGALYIAALFAFGALTWADVAGAWRE